MANVFWDSNLFIYLFEQSVPFGETVRDLRRRMRARGDRLYTSCLTVGEILVKPAEMKRKDLAEKYSVFFNRSGLTLVSFDQQAALRYAQIRIDRSITRPDAIQLACAASAGVDLFITNDTRLSRAVVPGIDFISSLERAPL